MKNFSGKGVVVKISRWVGCKFLVGVARGFIEGQPGSVD